LYEKKKARLARRRILEKKNKENAQADTQVLAEKSTAASTSWTTAPLAMVTSARAKPIGLVYLTSSQNFADPLHQGECNIGFYVAPEYRTLNRLSNALFRIIEDAFRDPDCHRLQALLVDHPDIIDFLNLYASA
jgi:RimJ/RimL family protein N-acetyltransferase